MSTIESSALSDVASWNLVEELSKRDELALAVRELRRRVPWWRRFQLGPHVWGLSSSWLAVCPWNSMDEAWISLPLVTLIAGKNHIELVLGHGKWTVNFDMRWRWE